MKYVDEYRDAEAAQKWLDAIRATVTRPWTLMEICGGQTHKPLRSAGDPLLPREVKPLHRPRCPGCVTPGELIRQAGAPVQAPNRATTTVANIGQKVIRRRPSITSARLFHTQMAMSAVTRSRSAVPARRSMSGVDTSLRCGSSARVTVATPPAQPSG